MKEAGDKGSAKRVTQVILDKQRKTFMCVYIDLEVCECSGKETG
jgi:hypothetical protein